MTVLTLYFTLSFPFLIRREMSHFHFRSFYICTNTKMLMLIASSLKLRKKSGGASPCVCKQYQLTKASCKLPQYQLKEWKKSCFLSRLIPYGLVSVLAKMATFETFLLRVHFQEVGIGIFRFGQFLDRFFTKKLHFSVCK